LTWSQGNLPAKAHTYLSFLSLNSIYQQHVSYQVTVAQSLESAYSGLKSSFSEKELTGGFTPAAEEFELTHSVTTNAPSRIVFPVLLKTF
jgi:hypothetical protein